MRVLFVFVGREPEQFPFDFKRRFSRRQSCAVADSEYMGIHGYGGFAECGIQHDIRSLSADPRQGFQFSAGPGHFALVLLDQGAAGGNNIFCLCVKFEYSQ